MSEQELEPKAHPTAAGVATPRPATEPRTAQALTAGASVAGSSAAGYPTGEATDVEDGSHADHFRHSYTADKGTLIRRLRRIEGQVRGISRMIEREEYCIDILQQTAALRAAVESVSLLILEDHVQGCVRTAAERGEADRYVDEVLDVVRRSLGRPVRASRS